MGQKPFSYDTNMATFSGSAVIDNNKFGAVLVYLQHIVSSSILVTNSLFGENFLFFTSVNITNALQDQSRSNIGLGYEPGYRDLMGLGFMCVHLN